VLLDNQTRWPAIGQATELGGEETCAVIIVKRTYDLARDGSLTPSAEPLPLVPDLLETAYGIFHGELYFSKQGADLCVLGTVRRARPVTSARVHIRLGRHQHALRVVGDRVWQKQSGGALVPGPPRPFTEMPLSYGRAFGGTADHEGYDSAWPDNPTGVGYYLTAEQAVDHPLANIEEATAPESYLWSDRPPVAGWGPYPNFWGLRAMTAVKVRPDRPEIESVSTSLFNHAHPRLMVPAIVPGETVVVEGLDEAPLAVEVPRDRLLVETRIGGRSAQLDTRIDGVFIWTDARKMVVTSRCNHSYRFHPHELREAILQERSV
jgi:hypothetical protein